MWARLTGSEPLRVRTRCGVLDTLALAREMHPGQRNGLDALCKRYSIDNSHRQLHGALLDARILADVYLAMTGGQSALALDEAARTVAPVKSVTVVGIPAISAPLRVVEASAEERLAHDEMMKLISKASGGKALWQ
jgi:DNA polymerase-3 subunit epsilon